ncbi:uncharacterized protein J3R85_013730 [Psidium guajava]|nr:uncharacterized protein J3R85_013730 [Psidium guajava]
MRASGAAPELPGKLYLLKPRPELHSSLLVPSLSLVSLSICCPSHLGSAQAQSLLNWAWTTQVNGHGVSANASASPLRFLRGQAQSTTTKGYIKHRATRFQVHSHLAASSSVILDCPVPPDFTAGDHGAVVRLPAFLGARAHSPGRFLESICQMVEKWALQFAECVDHGPDSSLLLVHPIGLLLLPWRAHCGRPLCQHRPKRPSFMFNWVRPISWGIPGSKRTSSGNLCYGSHSLTYNVTVDNNNVAPKR